MISIVIAVKDDRRVLNTLKGVFSQKNTIDFEVIIVDASSGYLDDIKNIFKNKVKWVSFENSNINKRTTASQINLGIDISKGNIIAFIDADCIPTNKWLYHLTKPLICEGEYYVAGLIKSLGRKSQMDDIWSGLKKYEYIDFCPNMNSAIRRELIKKVGKYDDVLFNYGWDVDYSWRAQKYGYRIRYVPAAIIYHDWGNLKAELNRNFHYGEARVRLYRKHKDKIKKIFFNDPLTIIYPVIILSIPLIIFYPSFGLIFILLILNNIRRINPIRIILSHFAYGFGILKEVFNMGIFLISQS